MHFRTIEQWPAKCRQQSGIKRNKFDIANAIHGDLLAIKIQSLVLLLKIQPILIKRSRSVLVLVRLSKNGVNEKKTTTLIRIVLLFRQRKNIITYIDILAVIGDYYFSFFGLTG